MRTPKKGNKIVSRGQRNRLHQKKNTAKNKYASRSPPTTSFKERHPPEGTQIEIKKESSKTEGQKAAPIKTTNQKPHHIAIKSTLAICIAERCDFSRSAIKSTKPI